MLSLYYIILYYIYIYKIKMIQISLIFKMYMVIKICHYMKMLNVFQLNHIFPNLQLKLESLNKNFY